jgi:PAS domain-containing protein
VPLAATSTGEFLVDGLVEALESTADGAFIVDCQLKIVFANRAAQKFMGQNLDANERQYCFQILRGRNESGRLVCTKNCRVANLLFSGASVSDFDLQAPTPFKPERWLNMSAFRYDQEEGRDLRREAHRSCQTLSQS